MKAFKKILVFALVAVLAVNGFSVNVKASNCTDYTKVYEKCVSKEVQEKIDAIKDKIAAECKDVDCVDPEKSTMITFEGSPVKVVKYDGNKHGLGADVRQTVSGKYITEPVVWYVGVTAEKEIYQSLVAPSEVGYYYVVAVYPGSCEWYPSVAYGVVVILPVCEKPEEPVEPEVPVEPDEPVIDEPIVDEPIEDDEVEDEEPVIEVVEDEDAAPKTGDSANVMLYGVALAAALVAIVAVLRRRNA